MPLLNLPLRTSALVLLLSGATLLAPAQAVDQVPSGWVPISVLFQDLADHRPGALLEYQVQAFASDIHIAREQFERQYLRNPTSFAELQAADLLPFLPLGDNGKPLRLVELANQELPQADELGVQIRPNEINLYAMGADGDPLSPLVKRISSQMWDESISLPFPQEQRRLLALQSTLERRLDAYYQLTGEFPADWPTLAQTLGWTFSPSYTLDGPAPSLSVRFDPARKIYEMERTPGLGYAPRLRYGLESKHNYTRVRWLPYSFLDQTIHLRPWLTIGVSTQDSGHSPTDVDDRYSLGHSTAETAELAEILSRFFGLHQRLPTVPEVENLISTRMMWEGKPLPFLPLPDFTEPLPADREEEMQAREALVQSAVPALVWRSDGKRLLLISRPRPPLRLPPDFPEERRRQLEAQFQAKSRQTLAPNRGLQPLPPLANFLGGPLLEQLPIPSQADPQAGQDDWVERWLIALGAENGIRLTALHDSALIRLRQHLERFGKAPISWEAMDAAFGLQPVRYRYIDSLDLLAPGQVGIALEISTTARRLIRITLQTPAGPRRQRYFAKEPRYIIDAGEDHLLGLLYPEYAAQEFTLIGAVVLDPLQEDSLP